MRSWLTMEMKLTKLTPSKDASLCTVEGCLLPEEKKENTKEEVEKEVSNVTGDNTYNNLKGNVNIKGLYNKNKKGIE